MIKNDWPALNYEEFKSTSYLLHMCLQVIGKFKLFTPFEPQWANVVLWLTSRGLTTGIIPCNENMEKVFSIDVDMIDHNIIVTTSTGEKEFFKLETMSVAQFTNKLFVILKKLNINLVINLMPQEILNPIPFNEDKNEQIYVHKLANRWWQILLKNSLIMQRYHAVFNGKTQSIGLMWGTFDLRDVRYNGKAVTPTGIFSEYIRRNSGNEAQIEIGWWPGNKAYPKAAYFSFTYPQPEGIEKSIIKPDYAHWDSTLMEFILDYDDLRKSDNPDKDLLDFFVTTYEAGSKLAGWDPKLITAGHPI